MKRDAAPPAVAPPDVSTTSYAENRRVLREVADRLRTETDLDIDELIPLIDQASAAYRACRARVDAVEQLIADRLPQGAEHGVKK